MTLVIDIQSRKVSDRNPCESVLSLGYIVRRESKHVSVSDRRRRVNYVLVAYFDHEGFEYRKSFESYDVNPKVPKSGTHKELNALAVQY